MTVGRLVCCIVRRMRSAVAILVLSLLTSSARADDDKECRSGNLPACMTLADREAKNDGKVHNVSAAFLRFQLLCNYGVAGACARADELTKIIEHRRPRPSEMTALALQCRRGDADGCLLGAMAAQLGENDSLAADLYDRACTFGLMFACYRLALIYDPDTEWEGRAKDDAHAFKFYERACNLAGVGCHNLSFYYRSGGRLADAEKEYALALTDCERQHNGEACLTVASTEYARRHPRAAHRRFEQACELGSPTGCDEFAHDLLHGRDETPQDPQRALSVMRPLCKDAEADTTVDYCDDVGFALDATDDIQDARVVFARRCEVGSGIACWWMGQASRTARGEPKDLTRALTFYRRSCGLHFAGGCYRLGVAMHFGQGIRANPHAALQRFEEACDGKVVAACLAAAILQSSADRAKAQNAFERGCKLGDDDSCQGIELLKAGKRMMLTPPRD
ncbi:MAG: hypothetical protein JWN44_4221 [Myxococcales bacterium]|nr:hypothetical protein [Myxococcales bacterium]